MSRTTIGNRRIATITAIIALVVFCLGSFAQRGFTQTITAYDLYMNPNNQNEQGFFVRAGVNWIYEPVSDADDFKLRPATIYPYGRIRVDSGGTLLFDQLSFGAGTPAEADSGGALSVSGVTRYQFSAASNARAFVFSRNRTDISGGAIYNTSTIDLVNIYFDNNRVLGALVGSDVNRGGGAIYNTSAVSQGRGVIYLNQTYFTGNTSMRSAGAVYNVDGTMTFAAMASFSSGLPTNVWNGPGGNWNHPTWYAPQIGGTWTHGPAGYGVIDLRYNSTGSLGNNSIIDNDPVGRFVNEEIFRNRDIRTDGLILNGLVNNNPNFEFFLPGGDGINSYVGLTVDDFINHYTANTFLSNRAYRDGGAIYNERGIMIFGGMRHENTAEPGLAGTYDVPVRMAAAGGESVTLNTNPTATSTGANPTPVSTGIRAIEHRFAEAKAGLFRDNTAGFLFNEAGERTLDAAGNYVGNPSVGSGGAIYSRDGTLTFLSDATAGIATVNARATATATGDGHFATAQRSFQATTESGANSYLGVFLKNEAHYYGGAIYYTGIGALEFPVIAGFASGTVARANWTDGSTIASAVGGGRTAYAFADGTMPVLDPTLVGFRPNHARSAVRAGSGLFADNTARLHGGALYIDASGTLNISAVVSNTIAQAGLGAVLAPGDEDDTISVQAVTGGATTGAGRLALASAWDRADAGTSGQAGFFERNQTLEGVGGAIYLTNRGSADFIATAGAANASARATVSADGSANGVSLASARHEAEANAHSWAEVGFFQGNVAVVRDGGAIHAIDGVLTFTASDVDARATTIARATGRDNTTIAGHVPSTYRGFITGAFARTQATAEAYSGTFIANTALSGFGGAIYTERREEGSSDFGILSFTAGGAVANAIGIATETTTSGWTESLAYAEAHSVASQFENNTALSGGAIFSLGGTIRFETTGDVSATASALPTSFGWAGLPPIQGGMTAPISSIYAEARAYAGLFTGNTATGDGSIHTTTDPNNPNVTIQRPTGRGGAIYNRDGDLTFLSTATVTATAIASGPAPSIRPNATWPNLFYNEVSVGNIVTVAATGYSQAWADVAAVIFDSNTAGQHGGAIYTERGTLTFIGTSRFLNNIAGTHINVVEGHGGAIYNDAGHITLIAVTNDSDTLTIGHTVFMGNRAERGGAIYNDGVLEIFNASGTDDDGHITGHFVENRNLYGARLGGHTRETTNIANLGGALYVTRGGEYDPMTGEYSEGGGSALLGHVRVEHNDAVGDGMLTGHGAGIYIEGSQMLAGRHTRGGRVDIRGGSFAYNHAEGDGGAIYQQANVLHTDISGNAIGGNELTVDGTGFSYYDENRGRQVRGVVFDSNRALGRGGAVFTGENTEAIFTDVEFTANRADQGGAVWNEGTLTFANALFINNFLPSTSTTMRGGAIFNTHTGEITFTGVRFTENRTTELPGAGGGEGAAIYNWGGILTFLDDTVFDQHTAVRGGAIYNAYHEDSAQAGIITLINAGFNNNTATEFGAAIFSDRGVMHFNVTDGEITIFERNFAAAIRPDGSIIGGTSNTEESIYFAGEGNILNINIEGQGRLEMYDPMRGFIRPQDAGDVTITMGPRTVDGEIINSLGTWLLAGTNDFSRGSAHFDIQQGRLHLLLHDYNRDGLVPDIRHAQLLLGGGSFQLDTGATLEVHGSAQDRFGTWLPSGTTIVTDSSEGTFITLDAGSRAVFHLNEGDIIRNGTTGTGAVLALESDNTTVLSNVEVWLGTLDLMTVLPGAADPWDGDWAAWFEVRDPVTGEFVNFIKLFGEEERTELVTITFGANGYNPLDRVRMQTGWDAQGNPIWGSYNASRDPDGNIALLVVHNGDLKLEIKDVTETGRWTVYWTGEARTGGQPNIWDTGTQNWYGEHPLGVTYVFNQLDHVIFADEYPDDGRFIVTGPKAVTINNARTVSSMLVSGTDYEFNLLTGGSIVSSKEADPLSGYAYGNIDFTGTATGTNINMAGGTSITAEGYIVFQSGSSVTIDMSTGASITAEEHLALADAVINMGTNTLIRSGENITSAENSLLTLNMGVQAEFSTDANILLSGGADITMTGTDSTISAGGNVLILDEVHIVMSATAARAEIVAGNAINLAGNAVVDMSGSNTQIVAYDGNVNIGGTAEITMSGTGATIAANRNRGQSGDITIGSWANILMSGQDTEIRAAGNIQIAGAADVELEGNTSITARLGDLTIGGDANFDMGTNSSVSAGGLILIGGSANIIMDNNAAFTAGGGDITILDTTNLDLANNAVIKADQSVDIHGVATIVMDEEASIIAEGGSVILRNSANVDMATGAEVTAGRDVSVGGPALVTMNENTTITAQGGSINFVDTANINMAAGAEIAAEMGIAVAGVATIDMAENAMVSTETGDIAFGNNTGITLNDYASIIAKGGDITISSAATITMNGTDTAVTAYGHIDIVGDAFFAMGQNAAITAESGNIIVGGNAVFDMTSGAAIAAGTGMDISGTANITMQENTTLTTVAGNFNIGAESIIAMNTGAKMLIGNDITFGGAAQIDMATGAEIEAGGNIKFGNTGHQVNMAEGTQIAAGGDVDFGSIQMTMARNTLVESLGNITFGSSAPLSVLYVAYGEDRTQMTAGTSITFTTSSLINYNLDNVEINGNALLTLEAPMVTVDSPYHQISLTTDELLNLPLGINDRVTLIQGIGNTEDIIYSNVVIQDSNGNWYTPFRPGSGVLYDFQVVDTEQGRDLILLGVDGSGMYIEWTGLALRGGNPGVWDTTTENWLGHYFENGVLDPSTRTFTFRNDEAYVSFSDTYINELDREITVQQKVITLGQDVTLAAMDVRGAGYQFTIEDGASITAFVYNSQGEYFVGGGNINLGDAIVDLISSTDTANKTAITADRNVLLGSTTITMGSDTEITAGNILANSDSNVLLTMQSDALFTADNLIAFGDSTTIMMTGAGAEIVAGTSIITDGTTDITMTDNTHITAARGDIVFGNTANIHSMGAGAEIYAGNSIGFAGSANIRNMGAGAAITANNGDITVTGGATIEMVGTDVVVTAKNNIRVGGIADITMSGANTRVKATDGDIFFGNAATLNIAGVGSEMTAGGHFAVSGIANVTMSSNTNIDARSGDVAFGNNATITMGDDAEISAFDSVTFGSEANIQSMGAGAKITAKTGNIVVVDAATIVMTGAGASIYAAGNIDTGSDATITMGRDTTITAEHGSMIIRGDAQLGMGPSAIINSGKDIIAYNADITMGSQANILAGANIGFDTATIQMGIDAILDAGENFTFNTATISMNESAQINVGGAVYFDSADITMGHEAGMNAGSDIMFNTLALTMAERAAFQAGGNIFSDFGGLLDGSVFLTMGADTTFAAGENIVFDSTANIILGTRATFSAGDNIAFRGDTSLILGTDSTFNTDRGFIHFGTADIFIRDGAAVSAGENIYFNEVSSLEFGGRASIAADGNIYFGSIALGSPENSLVVGTTISGKEINFNGDNDFYFDLVGALHTDTILTLTGSVFSETQPIGAGDIWVKNLDASFATAGIHQHIVLVKVDGEGEVSNTGTLQMWQDVLDEFGEVVGGEYVINVPQRNDSSGWMIGLGANAAKDELWLVVADATGNTDLHWIGEHTPAGHPSPPWDTTTSNWSGELNGIHVNTFLHGDRVLFDDRAVNKIVMATDMMSVGSMAVVDTGYIFDLIDGGISAERLTWIGGTQTDGNINFGNETTIISGVGSVISAEGTTNFGYDTSFRFDMQGASANDIALDIRGNVTVEEKIGSGNIHVTGIFDDRFQRPLLNITAGDSVVLIDASSSPNTVARTGNLTINNYTQRRSTQEGDVMIGLDTNENQSQLLLRWVDARTNTNKLDWTGAESNVWDVNMAKNWNGIVAGIFEVDTFLNGDTVYFGNVAANRKRVNIAEGGVNVNSMYVTESGYIFDLRQDGIGASNTVSLGDSTLIVGVEFETPAGNWSPRITGANSQIAADTIIVDGTQLVAEVNVDPSIIKDHGYLEFVVLDGGIIEGTVNSEVAMEVNPYFTTSFYIDNSQERGYGVLRLEQFFFEGWNDNTKEAANALNILRDIWAEDNLELFTMLARNSSSAANYTRGTELVASSLSMAMWRPWEITHQRLRTIRQESGWNSWGTTYYQFGDMKSDKNARGYSSHRTGTMVGVDYGTNRHWQVGTVLGYAVPKINNSFGKIDADDVTLGLYSKYNFFDKGAINMFIGYGAQHYKMRRNGFGTGVHRGSYSGDASYASIEYTRIVDLGGVGAAMPLVAIDHQTVWTRKFSETGQWGQTVAGTNFGRTMLRVGLDSKWDMDLMGSFDIGTRFQVGVLLDGNRRASVMSHFPMTNASMKLRGADIGVMQVNAGITASGEYKGRYNWFLDLDGFITDRMLAAQAGIGISTRW